MSKIAFDALLFTRERTVFLSKIHEFNVEFIASIDFTNFYKKNHNLMGNKNLNFA